MRRQLTLAVVGCVAGAGLVLLAASRVWAEVETGELPVRTEPRTGAQLFAWLPAAGLAALAGAGALIATRGIWRRAVGVLLILCGLAAIGTAGYAVTEGAGPGWPAATAVGGGLMAWAGAAATAVGARWPVLGTRYERPADADPWAAMDRGEDPTAG